MRLDIYGDSLTRSTDAERIVADGVTLHPTPQTVIESHENATYFPAAHGLYDRHGVRIANSLLWRDRIRKDHDTWPGNGCQWRDVGGQMPVFDDPLLYLERDIFRWSIRPR